MKNIRWAVLAFVALAVAIGIIYREPLVLRITSIRPFVEDRFGGWVEAGANESGSSPT
jgi:hypothetical protein